MGLYLVMILLFCVSGVPVRILLQHAFTRLFLAIILFLFDTNQIVDNDVVQRQENELNLFTYSDDQHAEDDRVEDYASNNNRMLPREDQLDNHASESDDRANDDRVEEYVSYNDRILPRESCTNVDKVYQSDNHASESESCTNVDKVYQSDNHASESTVDRVLPCQTYTNVEDQSDNRVSESSVEALDSTLEIARQKLKPIKVRADMRLQRPLLLELAREQFVKQGLRAAKVTCATSISPGAPRKRWISGKKYAGPSLSDLQRACKVVHTHQLKPIQETGVAAQRSRFNAVPDVRMLRSGKQIPKATKRWKL